MRPQGGNSGPCMALSRQRHSEVWGNGSMWFPPPGESACPSLSILTLPGRLQGLPKNLEGQTGGSPRTWAQSACHPVLAAHPWAGDKPLKSLSSLICKAETGTRITEALGFAGLVMGSSESPAWREAQITNCRVHSVREVLLGLQRMLGHPVISIRNQSPTVLLSLSALLTSPVSPTIGQQAAMACHSLPTT